jgi:hypothetical protein
MPRPKNLQARRSLDPRQALARRWNVSRAEVVRRAVEAAESQPNRRDALSDLKNYHQTGGLSADRANEYLREWNDDRNEWGRG